MIADSSRLEQSAPPCLQLLALLGSNSWFLPLEGHIPDNIMYTVTQMSNMVVMYHSSTCVSSGYHTSHGLHDISHVHAFLLKHLFKVKVGKHITIKEKYILINNLEIKLAHL